MNTARRLIGKDMVNNIPIQKLDNAGQSKRSEITSILIDDDTEILYKMSP